MIGINNTQISAQKRNRYGNVLLAIAVFDSGGNRSASTRTASQGLTAPPFPNAHFQVRLIDHAHKLRIHAFGKQLAMLKKRPDRRQRKILDIIGKNNAKLDLDIYYKALTAEHVKALHEAGIEVNCWTVDQPEDAEKLIGYGVDYITSNILE